MNDVTVTQIPSGYYTRRQLYDRECGWTTSLLKEMKPDRVLTLKGQTIRLYSEANVLEHEAKPEHLEVRRRVEENRKITKARDLAWEAGQPEREREMAEWEREKAEREQEAKAVRERNKQAQREREAALKLAAPFAYAAFDPEDLETGYRNYERYAAALAAQGGLGTVAARLFLAQKASSDAKRVNPGKRDYDDLDKDDEYGERREYMDRLYTAKSEAIEELCVALRACGLNWGWGADDAPHKPEDVLYIDLPTGQVSFHNYGRHEGPDYNGVWDGAHHESKARILMFCESLLPPPCPS